MADAGHKETEEILAGIEKRIAQEYKQAEKEVAAKLDDYLKRFETKDKLKRKALDNGLITQEEYDKWRIGQIMIGERWTKMRDSIAQDFTNASEIAKGIAFDKMSDVYALNFNYGTYQVEKGARMDTSFTLYDRNAVQELMKNEDTFIPAPGKKVQRDINEGKTLAWNKKQVQSVMLQGILQGESIPNLATRLAKTVGDSDRKASIRNARTMTTGVQNAGRVASYERANDMGIETQKQWLATLDDRTRHEHAALDGVTVPYDEPFENEYGEIDYPGDPAADPSNIFNCRCTLIASIKGFERDLSDKCQRDDRLGDMSYDDWKAGHYEERSDDILKQDDIEEIMRWRYGADYRQYVNSPDPDAIIDSFKPSPEEISAAAELIRGGAVSEDTIDKMYTEDADKSKIIALTTGSDIETAKEYQNVLEAWCGEEYKNIRAFQNGDMTYSSLDGVKQGAINAPIIEQFIEKSPKWKGGTTYRGISGSEDILDKIRESLHNGSEYSMLGTAAWAFTKDVAQDFATRKVAVPIIFVSQTQKKGTAINAFSQLTYDNEVIVSEKARYQIVDMKQKDGIWWINVRE